MSQSILIVEDEALIAQNLSDVLESHGYEVTAIAHNPDEALDSLQSKVPDLIIMDISLGKGNIDGIELASRINKTYTIPVIYLTDHQDQRTIEKSRNIQQGYYMPKPFIEASLMNNLEMIFEKTSDPQELQIDGIFIKDDPNSGLKVKVLFEDIIYVKADGAYCNLCYIDPKTQIVKESLISKSMGVLVKDLDPRCFKQAQRSYTVNINHIQKKGSSELVMTGDKSVPIGDNFKALFKRILGV